MQPTIVFISGWAMPSAVFKSVTQRLANTYSTMQSRSINLTKLVLPHAPKALSWETLLQALHQQLADITTPLILVGWSLGGTVALRYAQQYPQQVQGIITLATNTSFVQKSDSPHGMTKAQFEQFYQGMQQNSAATLQQFALLCSLGSPTRKTQAKWLQSLMCDDHAEHLQALLRLLDCDLRTVLPQLTCPVTHILAEKDTLVPITATQAMREHSPHHKVLTHNYGHTFFIDDATMLLAELSYLIDHDRPSNR